MLAEKSNNLVVSSGGGGFGCDSHTIDVVSMDRVCGDSLCPNENARHFGYSDDTAESVFAIAGDMGRRGSGIIHPVQQP